MLKTADDRCFFTHQNNFPQLIEFARTCDAEISVVKASDIKIQDLEDLAKSICDHKPQHPIESYEVLEVKIPLAGKLKPRQMQLNRAKEVSNYIKGCFLANKGVSLKDLETKFQDLSKPALSNHMTRARKELGNKGYTFLKTGPGKYVLSTSTLNKNDEYFSSKKTDARSKSKLGSD